ncbi:hypothetical protein [Aequorivita lipolytica]|uniref:Cell wall anchor protein n=1 Tax=Aequorivita lipolytica TaxID=153267 RepID=A0A5C6YSZ8_9FLAO|nr:hypothetical protein [Aequorivita lipolytica]TXD70572.1 hypothetical protein ESV24_00310 [Aequorivita lipolytica]SRX49600.1 hypothetical protein AEQU2_00062 [Aequorivita lipolytica]
MKNSYIKFSIGRSLPFVMLLLLSLTAQSQVGIGNTNPNPSSALDITSTTQGLLTPRMTTLQRTAISAPANSLLVYDTTLKAFYYYDLTSTTWIKINSATDKRNNYVLVKSAADLPAPVSGKITLLSNTYYEINGIIYLTVPIDLNDAYVSGMDANEDILYSATAGPVFQGTKGGSIRNVTISGVAGASALNITGGTSLLIQNTIIANLSSVGTISNVGLYFANIVQFVGNTTGITYSNITNLLLSNQAWLGTNNGTYETYIGTFALIQKASGFSNVLPGKTGMNTTGITSITGDAVLNQVVFYGGGTYVSGSSPYTGYNFNKDWTVDCPGIPREGDGQATANIYYTASSVVVMGNATPIKLPVTTAPIRMFRTSARAGADSSNSVVYEGKKSRSLTVLGSISFTAIAGMRFTFSIYKNGVQQIGTQVVYDVVDTNARQGLSIVGTVVANPTDYIEIYVERTTGAGSNQFLVTSYNLLVN